MRIRLGIAVVMLVAATVPVVCQDSAKALFYDTTSGVSVQAGGKTNPTHPNPSATTPAPAPTPVSTGVMYWMELKSSKNELVRVNSNHVFKSGDRIRFHLTSNTDGQLTVLQSQNASPLTVLFPQPGNTSTIRRFEEQILPSTSGWFRFDEQPGAIKLLIMITPTQLTNPVLAAGNPQSPLAVPAQDEARLKAGLQKQLELQQGSKALVVERDSSPQTTAEYVVTKNQDKDRGTTPLALEVTLKQQ